MLKPEEEWPQAEVGEPSEDNLEVNNEKPIFTLPTSDKLHELLVRYSSWTVLQRKIDWLLKFKDYIAHRNGSNSKYLTTEDLEKATVAIVKLIQREMYSEEIGNLEKRENVKGTSGIVRLRPVLIGGVIRVGCRISEAPITQGAKCPMIIPPKHHVARLLIEDYQQKLAHAGQEHILTQLRQQFWIPKRRSAERKVVQSCLTCKKQRATKM